MKAQRFSHGRTLAVIVTAMLVAGVAGCGADLGMLGGIDPKHGHAVGSGRIAASTKLGTPLNDKGFLLGMALESRAEEDVGARWVSGVMLGWGSGPAAFDGRVGFEAYGEFGTPLHSTLFRRADMYMGLALGVPIHFGSPRHVVDMNESTWVVMQRVEFVPLVRFRLHVDHEFGRDTLWRPEFSLGTAVRVRVFSDLF